MGLPNIFSKKTGTKSRFHITILLTDNSVSSALWEVAEQQISIIGKTENRYYDTEEDQLDQLDESLQDLGKDSDKTDQVLYALEPEWANQTEILAPYDERLEELSKELSLKAVGFVLVTEALSSHLLNENQYLSALLFYVGAMNLSLIMISQGKIKYTLEVGRSEDVISDVQEVLARLRVKSDEIGRAHV
jgi:hypothetical protein